MDIRLSCARYGNLEPTAYSVLRSLPDLALKHTSTVYVILLRCSILVWARSGKPFLIYVSTLR